MPCRRKTCSIVLGFFFFAVPIYPSFIRRRH